MLNKHYRTFSGADTVVYAFFEDGPAVALGALTTLSYSMFRPKTPVVLLGRIIPAGHTSGVRNVAGTMIFTLINRHFIKDIEEKYPYLKGFGELKTDELPQFDLFIVSANEYGASISTRISGVVFTDEGQVISVEDMFSEQQFSFMAMDLKNSNNIDNDNIFGSHEGTMLPSGPSMVDNSIIGNPDAIDIIVDGLVINTEGAPPFIENDRVFIPVRSVFEQIGYEVDWNDFTKEFKLIHPNGKTGSVSVDNGYAYGSLFTHEKILNPLPVIRDTPSGPRSFLPGRDLFELMGYGVGWIQETLDVIITSTSGNETIDNYAYTIGELKGMLNKHNGCNLDESSDSLTPELYKEYEKFCMIRGFTYNDDVDIKDIQKYVLAALKGPVRTKESNPVTYKNRYTGHKISILPGPGAYYHPIGYINPYDTFTIDSEPKNGYYHCNEPMQGYISVNDFLLMNKH